MYDIPAISGTLHFQDCTIAVKQQDIALPREMIQNSKQKSRSSYAMTDLP
jgi:hypothetical protein